MATNINGVTSSGPLSDPAPSVGGSFTMYGTISTAGGGGWNESGDMYFEWDQGTGSWTTIGSSGDLSTQDTNPLLTLQTAAEQSAVIDVGGAGSFQVRVRLIEDDLTEYTTTAIDVTVEDLAADRNISNVFDGVSVDDVPAGQGGDCVPDTFSSAGTDDIPTVVVEDPLPLSINVFDEVTVEEGITAVNEDLGSVLVVSEVTLEDVVVSAEILFLGWDNVFDEVTVEEDVTALVEDPAACEVDVFSAAELSEDIGSVTSLADTEVYDEVTLVEDITVSVEEAAAGEDININVFSAAVVAEDIVSVGGSEEVSINDTISVDEDVTISVINDAVTVWSVSYTTTGSTPVRSYRNILDAADISDPGISVNRIRVKFKAHGATYTYGISGASIGLRNASSDDYVTDSFVRLTFNGGSNSVSVPVGGEDVWSDWVNIDWFDESSDFLCHIDTENVGGTFGVPYLSGGTYRIDGVHSDAMEQYVIYGSATYTYGVMTVEVSLDTDVNLNVFDTISITEDITSVAGSRILAGDFDDWIDGEPIIGPTGDGDFENWIDGEPVVIVTEVGSGAPVDRNISVFDNVNVADVADAADLTTFWQTDFSEYTTGSPPSDWTARWATGNCSTEVVADASAIGGKKLVLSSTAAERQFLSWDDLDGLSADCNVLIKTTTLSDAALNYEVIRIYVRGSGAAAAENSYFISFSTAGRLSKYVAGASSTIESRQGTLTAATYWMRFEVTGTTVRTKVWLAGQPEPVEWQWSATDSSISAAGWVGVGGYEQDAEIDYFACGINGAAPPVPDADDEITTFGSLPLDGSADVGYTNVAGEFNRMMGGYAPDRTLYLTGVSLYIGDTHSGQARVAVYSGGASLTSPDGATLLHDFGKTSGSDTDTYYQIECDPVLIPPGDPLWIVVRTDEDGFSYRYSALSDELFAGNYNEATGRLSTTGAGYDPDSAFEDTFPSSAQTPADYWYDWHILVAESAEAATTLAIPNVYNGVSVSEAVELALSDAQVNTYDEVSVSEDVTIEVASEPTVVISVFDEVTGDESVECEVPDLFGSVYDEVSIDDVPEGKASDPQISVNDEVAVAEEVTSRIPVSIEVSDTVTAVEDQASALSVEVWEDDPTTVEEIISSFRNILAAGDIRDPGLGVKEIRIKLKAPAQNGYLVTGASIGVRDPGTEDYLPGTVTRITFDGGSVSAAVQSKDLWSDWVVFTAFDHTVDLMIHLDTALLDTVNWNQYSSNGDSYVKNGEFNDCMVEDISGYSFVNYSYNLKSLDVRASMVEGYDVNVYDNEGPSEAVSAVTSGLDISVYDETSVAESVDAIITTALSLSVYDEITVEETVEGIVSAVILSTEDSITVGEDVAGVTSLPGISVYEEVTVEEAVSGDISAITISTEDSVTVSEDIVSVTSLGGINTYDEISVVDILTVSSGEVTISVYDEVSTDDVAEGQYDLPLSVTDSITVTDVPSLLLIASGVFSVVDSVSVVDAATVELGDLTVSIYDEVTVTETVDLDIAVDSSVYDEVSVTDVPDVVLAELIVDVSDSVSVIEIEFSVAPELIIDVYSSGSVSDSAEGAAGDLVFSVFDAVSIADIDTVDVRLPGPIDVPVVSDTVSVADAVSATVSDLKVNVYDAVRITEYVEIYWEYSVGLIQLDCEGLVINISTEGQGLDVSCVGEYLDIASEGETLSFSCEGQDLTIETEVI